MRKATLSLILGILAASSSAFAVNTVNFTGSNSTATPSATFGSVTATAWSTTSKSDLTLLSTGSLQQYQGYGLGLCTVAEGGANCSSGSVEHQIDNNIQYEFILFKFAAAVDLKSITIANFGSSSGTLDADLSYWTSSATGQLNNFSASTSLSSLTGQTNVLQSSVSQANIATPGNVSSQNAIVDNISGTGVTYLLVGAAYGSGLDSNPDYFKIQQLDYNVSTATPEPATYAMFGGALVLVGFLKRRNARKL